MFTEHLLNHATKFLARAHQKKYFLASAESCTGGTLAGLWTSVAGASLVYGGGVVAYHNDWKKYFLAVDDDTLHRHGAVSEATAVAMVRGLLRHGGGVSPWAVDGCQPKITHGVAITGLAGAETPHSLHKIIDRAMNKNIAPNIDSGGDGKPDGLVFLAAGNQQGKILTEQHQWAGDRITVRENTLLAAMELLEQLWQEEEKIQPKKTP